MTLPPADSPSPTPPPAGPTARVTVRYWAAAREAAGVREEALEVPGAGAPVAEVLAEAVRRHPALGPVLPVCSLLVDGRVVGREGALPAGAVLEVLPPFAGG
ncbi:MAG TPA: MoaD/ThiS family protein [Dermatophilaceae bacterium]|nr:MoaD/ThiS family protein [Dermatophilaceae bacterium]